MNIMFQTTNHVLTSTDEKDLAILLPIDLLFRRQLGRKDNKATALFVLESWDSANVSSLWVGSASGDISIFPLGDIPAVEASTAAPKAAATWGAHGGGVNCLHGARGQPTVWSGGADWQAKQWSPAGELLRSLTEHTLPVPPPPSPRYSDCRSPSLTSDQTFRTSPLLKALLHLSKPHSTVAQQPCSASALCRENDSGGSAP
jgi:hypothetical protein